MPVIKRGNTWQVSVGSGSDRFRATAATEADGKMIEAQEILKRQKKALGILEPKAEDKPRVDVTLQRLFELAKRRKWLNKTDAQVKNAQQVITELGERTSVHDITRDCLHEFVENLYERGNSGATINRKLSALSVLLTIAEEEEWIDRAPNLRLHRQDEAKHRIRFFNNEEEAEMLAVCDKLGLLDLKDFIVFAIDTGFRRMEALGLSVRDCEDGTAVLHAGETKSGAARAVPLTDRAMEIVQRRSKLGYKMLFEDLSDAKLRKRWDILKANLRDPGDHFIVHTMRHTCASRLAISGENATFIQAWMGHSSIMVTQRYMHLAPDTLKKGTTSLDNYRKAGVSLRVVAG
jgi:integrase